MARHEQEFADFNAALTSVPVLKHYNPIKRLKASTYISRNGPTVVLLQAEGDDWKLVAYSSRSMAQA